MTIRAIRGLHFSALNYDIRNSNPKPIIFRVKYWVPVGGMLTLVEGFQKRYAGVVCVQEVRADYNPLNRKFH